MQYINNLPNINETFIIDVEQTTGSTDTCQIYVSTVQSCSGDTAIELTINDIEINADINPISDNSINLGSSVKRFREINTISGSSTFWNSTNSNITNLTTSQIDMGYDVGGDHRIITSNNSVLAYDLLNCGNY